MLITALLALSGPLTSPAEGPRRPLLLVHYMPWFEAAPGRYGWHWTMNKRDPGRTVNGLPDIASHFHPLIGPYDSGDSKVIECHLQLMKLAGLDGALVDWYGNVDKRDYGDIHRSVTKFFDKAERAKFKFALVYEDRTVPNLVKDQAFAASDAVPAGNRMMRWVERNWFSLDSYVRVGGRPLFMVFGPEYYKGDDWNGVFVGLKPRPFFVTLDSVQGPADGAFGWPQPPRGAEPELAKLDSYYRRAASLATQISPAFPRFKDYYDDAGVQPSYGSISDRGGQTFKETLGRAVKSGTPIVQVITWNDWGEGTQIEPSVEFGYRDLETIQSMRRKYIDKSFPYGAEDLKLPLRLLLARRKAPPLSGSARRLEALSVRLLAGDVKGVRKALDR